MPVSWLVTQEVQHFEGCSMMFKSFHQAQLLLIRCIQMSNAATP
eukprot:s4613_g2.t1